MEEGAPIQRAKVLVLDRREIVGRGLAHLLQESGRLEVVGVCGVVHEALRKVATESPDVVIVGAASDDNISDVVRRITVRADAPGVLVLSDAAESKQTRLAVVAGSRGYASLSCRLADLIDAVQVVADGGLAATGPVALQLATALGVDPAKPRSEAAKALGLTDREEEVLRLVARGSSNADVSAQLMISPNTVKAHVHSIMEKLHARSRVEAVIHGLESGIVPGETPVDLDSHVSS